MPVWFQRLPKFRSFLTYRAVYPVLLSTLLAIGLLAGRVYLMEKSDQRQTILPVASAGVNRQETEKPVNFGAFEVSISSWADEYERSFVRCLIEFSVTHALQLQREKYEKPGKFGVLRVFVNSWQDGSDDSFTRLLVEVSMSPKLTYSFLMWNLFLAWIPYLSSLWAAHLHQRRPGRWWYLAVPGILWLIFFPNAPYIVTDFLHLRARAPIPMWYDIGLLSVSAWTGLFLAVFSLRRMQSLVEYFVGLRASWLFVLGSLGLGGLGIYVGRFLRWNSWDLFLHPRSVLTDVAGQVADPWGHPGTFGVTLLFAAFLLICYLTLVIIPAREQS